MLPGRYLVVLWCALIANSPAWGASAPRIGVVNRDGALVRSGPGEQWYAADALRKGDRLEVYQVEEGGWCKVRPPAGSFSWVLAEHLKMTDTPNVAEVTGDDVRAYVGSRVRSQRDAVQVRLNRGELVEVVGKDELPSPETGATQTWYRIAPPAGEYRWVHLEFVDRERPTAPNNATRAIARDGQQPSAADLAAAKSGGASRQTEESSATSPSSPVRRANTRNDVVPMHTTASGAAKWMPLPRGTLQARIEQHASLTKELEPEVPAETESSPQPREGIKVVENFTSREAAPRILDHDDAAPISADTVASMSPEPDKASAVIAASATAGSTPLELELAELDVKFSLMVARPSYEWQLEPLMLRAQKIAEAAKTPHVHSKARALLEKMAQFARLQPGGSPLGPALPPTATSTPGLPASVSQPGPTGVAATDVPPNRQAGGLSGLLHAMDSLMPAQPPMNTAGVAPPGAAAHAIAGTGSPQLRAVSAQTPETAPASPADLTWGSSEEPSVRLPHSQAAASSPVGTGIADPAASPWRTTRANPSRPVAGAPAAPTGSDDTVLDRVKDTLLYPFGTGNTNAGGGSPDLTIYDGRGWLVPVVSRKGGRSPDSSYMPPFALTDAQGNVLQFVTPAPGVNLHRYLKQEIGVFGQQRPLDHLNEPHITASRIVMLDRHRR